MLSRLLIANRGEIACRVIRTARRLGVHTIAVYSDADAGALHTELADEAHRLGPAPAAESYADAGAILEIARVTGADAVHPGYGFLSEDARFAAACEEQGIVFVGPPADVIRRMGSKREARALMERAGVPIVPGYHGGGEVDRDPPDEALKVAALLLGFPIITKPVAGGGGKGMRVVERAEELQHAIAAARLEARASCGDERLLIERYLPEAHHVEVQIFGDAEGKVVQLGERDCSVQRRHQKMMEEAPAAGLLPAIRRELCEAALEAARAVGYVGAGTVEFLVEPSGSFYFIEMNTRLQVEHGLTELVTGVDLVEWQLRVASGEPLPLAQDDIVSKGHAVEARIYAEDPANAFLPSSGRLSHLEFPSRLTGGAGLRVDTGVRQGDAISPHYDTLIAKLLVHGADRAEALARIREALANTEIAGVATNLVLLQRLTERPEMREGPLDTGFVERHRGELLPEAVELPRPVLALATLAAVLEHHRFDGHDPRPSEDPSSPWAASNGWRLGYGYSHELRFLVGGRELPVRVHYERYDFRLELPDGELRALGELDGEGRLTAKVGGVRRWATIVREGVDLLVLTDGSTYRLSLDDPSAAVAQRGVVDDAPRAPLPGRVARVVVAPGDAVEAGDPLVVLEAMKMEHAVVAPRDGIVEVVLCQEGDSVGESEELVRLRAEADEPSGE